MKFNVRDEDGREYEVEEIKTDEDTTEIEPLDEDASCNDECLSPEEIASLRKLVAIADKLAALVETTDEDPDVEDEEEEIVDEEGEQIEEVIDTDEEIEPKTAKDSIKRSAAAIERRTKTVDSVEDDAVAQAWAKRYGGNK